MGTQPLHPGNVVRWLPFGPCPATRTNRGGRLPGAVFAAWQSLRLRQQSRIMGRADVMSR
jgi:hypothetical protein